MAKCSLIPNEIISKLAKERNMNPKAYLNSLAVELPKSDNPDKRLKNRFGSYLHDVLLTRDNGTYIIIHELQSDIEGMQLLELCEVRNSRITNRSLAYSNGIDFGALQSNPDYLSCVANKLLSQSRLQEKKQIAEHYNVDELYIGYVRQNKDTQLYEKVASANFLDYLSQFKSQLREKQEQKDIANREQAEKDKLISAINMCLNNLDLKSLNSLADSFRNVPRFKTYFEALAVESQKDNKGDDEGLANQIEPENSNIEIEEELEEGIDF